MTKRYHIFMHRDPSSHKGENGKVAVIGGSRTMHGAPIMSALAAEASGVDLLYLFVPSVHETVTKMASWNVQVRTFHGDELHAQDVQAILELLASMDCAVIGPGLGRGEATLEALRHIVTGAPCPLVLDATALQTATLDWLSGKPAVLTPHLGELERMHLSPEELPSTARERGVTFLVKGQVDRIVGPDGTQVESSGGNAGLTVGGTGDALAGFTAGLIAQRWAPSDAAFMASKCIKRAGEFLADAQGMAYTTRDVIEVLPSMLHSLLDEQ